MAASEKDQSQDPVENNDNPGIGETPNPSSSADAKAETAPEQSGAAEAEPEPEQEQEEAPEPAAGNAAPSQVVVEAEAILAAAQELEDAKAQAADWQDKYVRLHAEWDTYRRRMNDQRKEEKARATEKLMEDLLPVLDDFERTVDYANKNGEEGLLGGVQAVQNKLVDMLRKHGLETIDPAGQAFDALEAQAVAMVDDASVPEETVAQVYQKGYKMGGKVLRAAMVTVTQGGPKREVKEADSEEE